MKFFAKRVDSAIASNGLVYKPKGDNQELRSMLTEEQCGYCAYTEARLDSFLQTVAVEHFDPRLKGTSADGYRNYYAALQAANQRKRRHERSVTAGDFFAEPYFFQSTNGFEERIAYIPGEYVYEERALDDDEARRFIEYLDLNHPELVRRRREHVARLSGLFHAANYSPDAQRNHLSKFPSDLDYPTVMEVELGLPGLIVVPPP